MGKMIGNINLENAPADKIPYCPYCKMKLDTIWAKVQGAGLAGQEKILMCPHCDTLLGFTAWKRG